VTAASAATVRAPRNAALHTTRNESGTRQPSGRFLVLSPAVHPRYRCPGMLDEQTYAAKDKQVQRPFSEGALLWRSRLFTSTVPCSRRRAR
jgi:hypothetical protein